MPNREGQGPILEENLDALSNMTVQLDGGRKNMSPQDQEALDALIVEAQNKAIANGEIVKATDLDPKEIEDAMADHAQPWMTEEK